MKNCENLNILELVEKARKLDSVNVFLADIFSTLRQDYQRQSTYGDDFKESLKAFNAQSLCGRFSQIKQIIIEGNAEDVLNKIIEQKNRLDDAIKHNEEEMNRREEALLNAWNNFQSWKSETSRNLIKDLNSKFKENV